MSAPAVLFIVFNRPDTTAQVLAAIRRARPARLYVAADGPRADRPHELALCEHVRRTAMQVDWPCEVRSLFRERNLGCRVAVSTAIDWFFEHEEAGVILEDDCLPSPDFFPYCAELLERHREDERVMAICGSNYAKLGRSSAASYYFSYFADVWGWATWRRAWRLYDRDMLRWPAFKQQGGLVTLSGGRAWHEAYWEEKFNAVAAHQIDTWDYQWIFSVIDQHGLACYPVRNLVSNLGFRSDATHTFASADGARNPASALPLETLAFPLVHPPHLSRSPERERTIEALRLGLHEPAAPSDTRTRMVRRLMSLARHVLGDSVAGMVDYYRWPERGVAWGGAFNGQNGRRAIFNALLAVHKPSAILETGTFRGTTTEYFASTGLPVRTVEGVARNYGFARARLLRHRNVVVAHGDSRALLRDWVGSPSAPFHGQPVFAYLDAHWNADLPLAEELDLLFANCPHAIAMIDDFEVPGDAGYAFDDYGGGKALNASYIADVVAGYGLAELYPALASAQETGARRGCVVLCSASTSEALLAAIPLLRRSS